MTAVPATMDDLAAQYDRMIVWMLRKTILGPLAEEDLQDLRQTVYLRILRLRFLDRCRTHVTRAGGSFSTSLCRLVRNEARRWAKIRQRERRRTIYGGLSGGRAVRRMTERSHAAACEACEFLDVLERRLRQTPVPGKGQALGDVLRAARASETFVSVELMEALPPARPHPASVRRYMREIREVATELRETERGDTAAAV